MDSFFFTSKRFARFVVCFVVCILSSSVAYAASDLSEQVTELLHDELPDLSVVLPDYVAPHGNAPSLAIGDFYTESSDKTDWGRVLGEVLRTSLTVTLICHLEGSPVVMPGSRELPQKT